MKSYGRLLALLALFGANQISAAVAVGDNAELFLTGSASIAVDDNIYLRSGVGPGNARVNDVITVISPGVDFVFGRNSLNSGNAYLRHDWVRYADNSVQNTGLLSTGVNSLYSNGKTKFDFGASYQETAQNDPNVAGRIVDRDAVRVRGIAEFGVSQKTTLAAGLRYEGNDYSTVGLRDNDIWTVPVDVYLESSEKLSWSGGYRYRFTDVAAVNSDRRDHFFNIGARGEFTPKLVGQVRVGYVVRDYESARSNDGRLGVDASINFSASEKTSFSFGFNNDFGTSALGDSTEESAVYVSATSLLTTEWSATAQLAFRSTDYLTRSDDYVQAGLSTSYRFSEMISVSASYTYRRNNSTIQQLDFRNNIFSLAANIRY